MSTPTDPMQLAARWFWRALDTMNDEAKELIDRGEKIDPTKLHAFIENAMRPMRKIHGDDPEWVARSEPQRSAA